MLPEKLKEDIIILISDAERLVDVNSRENSERAEKRIRSAHYLLKNAPKSWRTEKYWEAFMEYNDRITDVVMKIRDFIPGNELDYQF